MNSQGAYHQGQQQYQGYGQTASQPQGYYQQPQGQQQQYQGSYAGQQTNAGGGFFQAQPQDQTANLFGAALPSAQLGLQLGTQALSVGQDYVNKNIDKLVPKQQLKSYFNVTNSYVFKKLLLVMFPFRHKSWERLVANQSVDGHAQSYAPPRDDINAPDLYIPMMGLVTYVLLVALIAGLQSKFHPEILGKAGSKVAIMTFLEWGAVKLGLYLLNLGADINSFDILSIIGYNYVGLIVSLLAGLLLGSHGKWAAFIYSSIAMFFFVLRSLRQNFLPESSEALVITQRRKRINFLFGIVCLQVLVAFFLVIF